MIALIKAIFAVGPLIFAFGFLAPLFLQIIERTELTPPFGLSPIATAFLLAAALGATAQVRGRWLW